ncbi:Aryl-phospho-beta-D-glucosidase BglC, GH1 family [Alteromonadaceae bacterium Bs31]|nr:Aryl-phospho-beta-D-glucosidase BglC, GH1 family [Alteromonadaceae bacterium Bs31]SMF61170.1 Aryl-phospho-beta-D-glucosidase BglC, GH1 family [Alteromonadaceae bacterium Bs31]
MIYEPLEEGETLEDTTPPVLVSGDGVEYVLPYIQVFDYGTPSSVVLEDFADNDHQNNLGGAVATYKGENYTEGGGYWYTFIDKLGSSIENCTSPTLAINAYNVAEAIHNNEICLDINIANDASGYGGFGSNILFEEAAIDLSDLTQVKITAYGSGSPVGVMFETTDIDRTVQDGWGNYAASTPITLSASPQVFTYNVSDFVGEEYSAIKGDPLEPHLHLASKFFFQLKDGATAKIHITNIEFIFEPDAQDPDTLRVAKFDWKNDDYDPSFVFDLSKVGVPAEIDQSEPYMDWSTAILTPAPTVMEADDTNIPADTGINNWLSVDGTKLRDSHGRLVRLTGVNWFGFETKNAIPFGLWARDYKDMLQQIADTGFNTVRIPFSDYIIDQSKADNAAYHLGELDITINASLNSDLNSSMTPLDLLDKIIEHARDIGLKIVLDNHSRGPDKYLVEGHWVTEEYPEEKWIANWVWLAKRYKDNDAVVALDLNNEPHFEAGWDSDKASNNWNEAAERCAAAIQDPAKGNNPNALIIIEGVEGLNENSPAVDKYWWGGNMKGVLTAPIEIPVQDKLVYSPHEYGPEVYLQPWFRDYRFPNNLPYIWEDRFGFIYHLDMGHLFVGEFGIKNPSPQGGISAAEKWFDEFVQYMADHREGYSWTYWAWNPNSGDTGGILTNNWEDVHQWKLDKLSDLQAPMIGNRNGK